MDEKQTAALREAFERHWTEHLQKRDPAFSKSHMQRWHDTGKYIPVGAEDAWQEWLACYQHLAPMVEDAERYRWLRNPNHDIEPVIDQRDEDATIDGIPTVIYEYRSGEELDKAIDAAREQEKKTC